MIPLYLEYLLLNAPLVGALPPFIMPFFGFFHVNDPFPCALGIITNVRSEILVTGPFLFLLLVHFPRD